MATTTKHDVKDLALAPEGVRRIEWADRQMPVLAAIRERFERDKPLSGYRVIFVPFQQGMPTGLPQTVVSGFHSADEKELYGAPVGLAQDADGALLIADDVGDTVWRVTAQ